MKGIKSSIRKLASIGNSTLTLVEFSGLSKPFPPHSHPYLVIGLIRNGCRICQINGQTYALEPGMLCIFEPDVVHSCIQEGQSDLEYCALQIDGSLYRSLLPLKPGFSLIPVSCENDLRESFLSLLKILDQNSSPAVWLRPLGQFLSSLPCTDSLPEISLSLQEKILQHDGQDGISSLARELHCSKASLYRLCQSRVFISPRALQLSHKAAKAQDLAGQGEKIAQIAAELEYFDQSDLSRQFKTFFGYTIGSYVRMLQDKKQE